MTTKDKVTIRINRYAQDETNWKKLSHYTPRRSLGGEEVYLPLNIDLSTRWD
jgi:hypothetical protein